ncbi:hypothetical protein A4H97_33290 [Niastella yeongjuensis]|uniref:Uncharacterized protein n=1 Tax=Niastella yeongjuensis TaxID=354355 RepID=A0A1V9EDM7_9BACT|nr:hypothetical protein [Niastella yeongjuensis]OQP44230.1 hypothetical protein A4H97_33290 [Niastella yeongjuensis]SEO40385.1 hypothetical protein SAMN05660816_02832 [Niastella yeongjuensis]
MGFYNVLITEMVCPNCGVSSPVRIQYKYGSTRQFEYRVGDTIPWEGNNIGNPELTNVKAYGIAESTTCPSCNQDKIPEDYDVFIKNNVITGVAPMENNDYLVDNVTYIDLNK